MKVALALCALVGLSTAFTIPGSEIFKDWEGRIVGGANAALGQFPYQASMRSAANAHFCGGWIHNTRWIVTAAHCTIGRTPANTMTVVGALMRLSGGVSHQSDRVVNHPNYNANTLANDISLVQTSIPIVFGANVNSIPLSTVNTGGSVPCVASGWGQTTHPGSAPDHLQFLNLSTMTLDACRAAHNIINRGRVHDSTICTTSPVGQGMCMGDSGGPLVAGQAVIGAVSWGIPCGNAAPDVFARVSSHVAWINSVV